MKNRLVAGLFLYFSICSSIAFGQDSQLREYRSASDKLQESVELAKLEKFQEALETLEDVDPRDELYTDCQYEKAYINYLNENSAESIEILKKGIATHASDHLSSYILLASVIDKKYGIDSSLFYFDLGARLFPMNNKFHFEKAIAYYNAKQIDKAVESLQKSIELNYFDESSHRTLALICFEQNQLSRGILSLITYLSQNPSDSRAAGTIVYAEPFLNEKVLVHSDSLFKMDWGNEFQREDLILKNKVALTAEYQLQSANNFKIIRQIQALLSLIKYNPKSKDFWMKNYGPVFKDVYKSGEFSGLTDYWLSSTTDDATKSYKNKKSEIDAIVAGIKDKMTEINREKLLPGYLEKSRVITDWNSEGIVNAVAENIVDGKAKGKVVTIYQTGKKKGEGSFNDNGELTGEWQYYDEDGKRFQTVIYVPDQDSLVYKTFSSNGVVIEEGTKIAGLSEGKNNYYYPDKTLKIRSTLAHDNFIGIAEEFYPDGQLKIRANYKDGKVDGEFTEYYENGQLKLSQQYEEGVENGNYRFYHTNGQVSSEGQMANDELDGEWQYYHSNASLSVRTSFVKGKQNGIRYEYYPNGKLMSKTSYKNGEANGEEIYYDYNGNEYQKKEYKNNNPVKIEGLKGPALGVIEKAKSNILKWVDFYPSGRLRSEVMYKNGYFEGPFKSFYPNGNVDIESNYLKGKNNGVYRKYLNTGELSFEYLFKSDTAQGEYKAYYRNGQVYIQGFLENNDRVGRWITYYKNGAINTDEYYSNGNLVGDMYNYLPNGKLLSTSTYEDRMLTKYVQYDKDEKAMLSKDFENGYGVYEARHLNRAKAWTSDLKKGDFYGESQVFHPNGKLNFTKFNIGSKFNGFFKYFDPMGVLFKESNYVLGEKSGIEKRYEFDGKISAEETYMADEENGPFKFYNDGILNSKGQYLTGEKEGEVIYYDKDGISPSFKYFYERGLITAYSFLDQDGKWKDWIALDDLTGKIKANYPSGKLSYEGEIIKGLLNGHIVHYADDGKKILERNYLSGRLNGDLKDYYFNGNLKLQYSMEGGDRNGESIEYHPNGQIARKGNYLNGFMHGLFEYYDESGKLLHQQNYYFDEAI